MRLHPAHVAIVDDDLDHALLLEAALAVDERTAVRRFATGAPTPALLGELLGWRADIVVLGAGTGGLLRRCLAACGVEVVLRDRLLDVVEADVRSRYALLRGRPAPPALRR